MNVLIVLRVLILYSDKNNIVILRKIINKTIIYI